MALDGRGGRALVAYFGCGVWHGGRQAGAWHAADVARMEKSGASRRYRGDDSLQHSIKRNE